MYASLSLCVLPAVPLTQAAARSCHEGVYLPQYLPLLHFAPLESSFVVSLLASVVYQDKLSAALEETLPNMKPPMHTAAWLPPCACFVLGEASEVWMNASAQPIRPGTDPKEIVALLKRPGMGRGSVWGPGPRGRQLTNPVLWDDSMKAILKEGVNELLGVKKGEV